MFFRPPLHVIKKALARLRSLVLAVFGNTIRLHATAALLVVICISISYIKIFTKEHITHYTAVDMKEYLENRSPLIEKSLIPWPLLQENSMEKQLRGLSTEYDPRLLPALWLGEITRFIDGSQPIESLELPFKWVSAVDLQPGIRSKNTLFVENCADFQRVLGIREAETVCQQVELPKGLPNFSIVGPTDEPLSEASRRYVGASYLLHSMELPKRAVLLGAGLHRNELLVLPVVNKSKRPYYEKSDILSLFKHTKGAQWILLGEQASGLRSRWNNTDWGSFKIQKAPLSLKIEETEFQAPDVYSLDPQLAANVKSADPEKKYFHEARLLGSGKGSHYDWRFFKTSSFSSYERTTILNRVTRAWLRFSKDIGLRAWLTHGTLLGWYWNGLNMPWDDDLDVQISMESLTSLAQNYNQTVVVDLSDDMPTGQMYFLDVNPNFLRRERGDGANVIDARFIDMSSGLYVDITGLAVSDDIAAVQNSPGSRQHTRLHQVFDPDYKEKAKLFDFDEELRKSTEQRLKHKEIIEWSAGRLYNCKDDHFYCLEELEPQKAVFEGMEAVVPSQFKKILKREYPRGTRALQHQDWWFSQAFGLWLPKKDCDKTVPGCKKEEWILEELFTRGYRHTAKHRSVTGEISSKVDPWILGRNRRLLSIV